MSFDVTRVQQNPKTAAEAQTELTNLQTGIRELETQLELTQKFYEQAAQPRGRWDRWFGPKPPMTLEEATTKLATVKAQLTTARELDQQLTGKKGALETSEREAAERAAAAAAKKAALAEAKKAEQAIIQGSRLEKVFGDKLEALAPADRKSLDEKYRYFRERLQAMQESTFGKQFFGNYAVTALESLMKEIKRVGLFPGEFEPLADY